MIKIVDKNRIPELRQQIKALDGKKIQVGVFGDKEADLAMIAGVNEFGADIKVTDKMRAYLHYIGIHLKKTTTVIKIPERAFLRITMDKKDTISKAVRFAERIFDRNQDPNQILDAMGASLVSSVQDTIESNLQPSNSDITVQKKGSAKTLQDKGRLKQGITYKIV